MDKLYKFIGLFAAAVGVAVYRYFVCVKVWGYIAVKEFGLAPITFYKAFALAWLLAAFTADYNSYENEEKDIGKRLLTGFVAISISWFLSYLIFGR